MKKLFFFQWAPMARTIIRKGVSITFFIGTFLIASLYSVAFSAPPRTVDQPSVKQPNNRPQIRTGVPSKLSPRQQDEYMRRRQLEAARDQRLRRQLREQLIENYSNCKQNSYIANRNGEQKPSDSTKGKEMRSIHEAAKSYAGFTLNNSEDANCTRKVTKDEQLEKGNSLYRQRELEERKMMRKRMLEEQRRRIY